MAGCGGGGSLIKVRSSVERRARGTKGRRGEKEGKEGVQGCSYE